MSVPIWVHVPIVVTMLSLHALTFVMMKRKIESLQLALVAKRALLGEDQRTERFRRSMLAGETLSFRKIKDGRIDITASHAVHLDVEVYRQ